MASGLSGFAHADDQTGKNDAAPSKPVDILEFVVKGNSVLDAETVEAAVEPFLGPQRDVGDVDLARAALEAVYQKLGFRTVTVAIPRQTVRGGSIALQVNEGTVGQLKVIGSKYHSPDQIKDSAASLAEGNIPNFNEVQKDIATLNQQQDRQVTPTLRAGTEPGTIDVDLVVNDHLPLHGSLELNNRQSQDTSELRSTGTLSYNNLWQLGHSLSVSFQTAPQNPDDASVLYASYLARSDGSPFSLLINGIKSSSDVSTVGGVAVLGRGEVVGLRAIWALPSAATSYQSLTLGVDYKSFKNRTSLNGDQFETPVTYYPLSLGYSAVQRLATGSVQGDLSVNLASPQLGSTSAELGLNRDRARGQQFYLRAGLNVTQALPLDAEALLRVNSQWTDQPLITNEQFSAGGLDSVRGYLEAETLGDYGYSAGIELHGPSIAPAIGLARGPASLNDVRFLAFADAASLQIHAPLPEQDDRFSIASFGGGLSFSLYSFLNGAVLFARPIINTPATRAWSSRVLFRVSGSF